MDSMTVAYFEETEDMLQKAEACLMKLETEYSPNDVNELFRIFHTIKGSSHVVGYGDIGDLTHRLEDLLDFIRNGRVEFEPGIASICLEGVDAIKGMLDSKKEPESEEGAANLANLAAGICEKVDAVLGNIKKNKEKYVEEKPDSGKAATVVSRERTGKNLYYLRFFIEEDAPMPSVVMVMILKAIEDIGSVVYSSVSVEELSSSAGYEHDRPCDFIISTDMDEVELYSHFILSYVERVDVFDLSAENPGERGVVVSQMNNPAYKMLFEVYLRLYHLFYKHHSASKIKKEELAYLKGMHEELGKTVDSIAKDGKTGSLIKEFNILWDVFIDVQERYMNIDDKIWTSLQVQYMRLLEQIYSHARGKHAFRVFRPRDNAFMPQLTAFANTISRSATLKILVDVSRLSVITSEEIQSLVNMKRQLLPQSIEMDIIANGRFKRRMQNIFDSIKSIEKFRVFGTELEAVLHTFAALPE